MSRLRLSEKDINTIKEAYENQKLYPYALAIKEKCQSLHRKTEDGWTLIDCEKCEFHINNEEDEPECMFDDKFGYPARPDEWRL